MKWTRAKKARGLILPRVQPWRGGLKIEAPVRSRQRSSLLLRASFQKEEEEDRV